jgi:hypothetical protein
MLLIRSWIDRTLAAHAHEARPVGEIIEACGFRRLPDYFDAALLGRIRCVAVERVPVPPLALMGLRLFAGFESKHYAGITYGDTYFVDRRYDRSESLHFHELIHAVQWDCLGSDKFLLAYMPGGCFETVTPAAPWRSWPTTTSVASRPTPLPFPPRPWSGRNSTSDSSTMNHDLQT